MLDDFIMVTQGYEVAEGNPYFCSVDGFLYNKAKTELLGIPVGLEEIDIPEDVSYKDAPFMISLFLKKGIRSMNSEWSMRWVQSRIIPSSRQNIGEILRVNGMRSYDEHKLLLKNEGRSCQDEFYIEQM